MKILDYGIENITKDTKVYFCGSTESFAVEMCDEVDETICLTSSNGSMILAHFEDCNIVIKEDGTIDDLIRALRVRKFNRKFKHKRIHR